MYDTPLAPSSGQFALTGSLTPADAAPASRAGQRPWRLRHVEPAVPGRELPDWRYDDELQLAVDRRTATALIDLPVGADPTANTTISKDGEDPPSSEDWNND